MILVTGGGGFIGLHIARDLAEQGQRVLLMGRKPIELPSFLTEFAGGRIKTVTGDICDSASLRGIVNDYHVESVIHAAAVYEPVDLYTTLQINLDGTREVLEVARAAKLRRVTFLSTVAVYLGSDSKESFREDAKMSFDSYGFIDATKKAGEQICQLYANTHKMSVIITRPPLVWGPLHHHGPWMDWVHGLMEKAFAGDVADYSEHYGPRKVVLCYVRDCARAIRLLHLAPRLNHMVYNFSDAGATSLGDLAEATKSLIPKADIRFKSERGAEEFDLLPYDLERIKADVGYVPEYDTRRAVSAYLEWLRDGTYS